MVEIRNDCENAPRDGSEFNAQFKNANARARYNVKKKRFEVLEKNQTWRSMKYQHNTEAFTCWWL